MQRELSAKMASFLCPGENVNLDACVGSVSGATDAITNDPKFSAALAAAINSIMSKEEDGLQGEEGGVGYVNVFDKMSSISELDHAVSRNRQVANRGAFGS